MNYLLRPEVIAAISLETQYANANLASLPLLPPELLNDPAVYPSADEREQLKVGYIFSPKAERNRTRIWARMKTGL
jgi:putrescine transport system substrate-binding protein